MDAGRQQHHAHLFTVRLWMEDLGNGGAEWRGQVQHVRSSEVRYIRDWPTLIILLQAMVSGSENNLDMQGGNTT